LAADTIKALTAGKEDAARFPLLAAWGQAVWIQTAFRFLTVGKTIPIIVNAVTTSGPAALGPALRTARIESYVGAS
jgi:hypothetical protein